MESSGIFKQALMAYMCHNIGQHCGWYSRPMYLSYSVWAVARCWAFRYWISNRYSTAFTSEWLLSIYAAMNNSGKWMNRNSLSERSNGWMALFSMKDPCSWCASCAWDVPVWFQLFLRLQTCPLGARPSNFFTLLQSIFYFFFFQFTKIILNERCPETPGKSQVVDELLQMLASIWYTETG